jgi:nitroimidazol reductase NimA-like FMN-containing flavoprotein (pyridoxamine 5'-phosphate oxidase superfamily)
MVDAGPPTPRTKVRRHPERGAYEREQIDAILDAAWLCHVAVVEDGRPRVTPMIFGRWRDGLVLHGALANQLLASGTSPAGDLPEAGPEVCVTVTVVDELVLARSAMHHSVNYRSVVAFGPLREITDPEEKRAALAAVVDHALPGRAGEARPPDDAELRATRVAALDLTEASAKTRTGPPADDPADEGLPVWSGTVPVRTVTGRPQPAPDRTGGVPDPGSVTVRGASS